MSDGRDSGSSSAGGPSSASGSGSSGSSGSSGGSEPSSAAGPDVLLVGPPVTEGDGGEATAHHVLRLREGRVELGELRAAREGAPVLGELVSLRPRPEHERAFDVEVLARGPLARAKGDDEARGELSGPPQVATPAYRAGWERTFGSKRDKPS